MMKKLAVWTLAALAVCLSVAPVLAQDAPEVKAEEPIDVTVKGENYCLLCTLSKQDLATASSAYAMLNALRVTEVAGADGAAIEGFAGKTLHYLPSKDAEALMVGEANQGKNVTVTGKLYKDANSLKVVSFVVEGAEASEWDELPVGSMSGKQVL